MAKCAAAATATGQPPYLRLSCAVQKYAWGKLGMAGEVARLKVAGDPRFTLEEDQTYAEVSLTG